MTQLVFKSSDCEYCVVSSCLLQKDGCHTSIPLMLKVTNINHFTASILGSASGTNGPIIWVI